MVLYQSKVVTFPPNIALNQINLLIIVSFIQIYPLPNHADQPGKIVSVSKGSQVCSW